MVKIVEQALQSPPNATPIGWDATTLVYPGVNTCATISTLPRGNRKSQSAGMLVGLHLGLLMAPYEQGKDAEAIDQDHLDLYLDILQRHTAVKGYGAKAIYVAGALEVWMTNAKQLWAHLKRALHVWSTKSGAPVRYLQFDPNVAFTADITVTSAGVTFAVTGSGTPVPVDQGFQP